jgi:hypothetical protein
VCDAIVCFWYCLNSSPARAPARRRHESFKTTFTATTQRILDILDQHWWTRALYDNVVRNFDVAVRRQSA